MRPDALRLRALFVALAIASAGVLSPPAARDAAAQDLSLPIRQLMRLADRDGLRSEVLARALQAFACARVGWREPLLTVIDYSLPSTVRRLWVIDVKRAKVLFHELVAHGRGTGELIAERFSNADGSHASSLGLFETLDTYEGGNGHSLRLRGLEPGVNDRAEERAIVMHGAWYVSDDHVRRWGRLGRSLGCPALDPAVHREVIDTIRGGTALFAYYPEPHWLRTSQLQCRAQAVTDAGL